MGVAEDEAIEFDAAGYVLRARRLADLNQREAANLVGAGKSTLARWETGERDVTVGAFVRLLSSAGLRLQVVDHSGVRVQPFAPDTLRDNAGRRFPAHLDVVPPDRRPVNRGYGQRYDRPPARGWYALRATRDAPGVAVTDSAERPNADHRLADHPTESELVQRKQRERPARQELARTHALARALPECTCLDDCFEHPACPGDCPCQCEPRHPGIAASLAGVRRTGGP